MFKDTKYIHTYTQPSSLGTLIHWCYLWHDNLYIIFSASALRKFFKIPLSILLLDHILKLFLIYAACENE